MLVEGFDQSREHSLSISPRCRHHRFDFVGLMRAVQEPQDLSHQRPQLSLVEPDWNRLPLHGMEDPEPAIRDRGGFGGIGRKLPLKRTVRLPPTTNVLLQIGAGADHLRIGIFQSPLTIGIVERGSLGKDIADGRIDRTGEKAVGLMETRDDFGRHPCNKGKGPGRVRTLQLDPGPRRQAEILLFGQTVPDLHDGKA